MSSISSKGSGGRGFELGFKPVKFIFNVFLFILGLTLAILIILTIYYGFTTGQAPKQVKLGLEAVHLDKPVISVINFLYKIITAKYTQEDMTGFSGTTRTVEEIFGIEIQDFAPNKKVVQLNEPILVRALINVIKTPANKEINLDFSNACYLEGYTDLETPKETVVIPKNRMITNQEDFVFPIRCEFPQGYSEMEAYAGTVGTVKKTSDLKAVRFTPTFAYSQEIGWQPFIKNIREQGDTILKASWDLSDGPATLRIGSDESQPFYSMDHHELSVYLTSNWPGNIKSVNSIQIDATEGIELLTLDKFCDFTRNGNVYVLKPHALEQTKIDCSSKSTLEKLKMLTPFKTDVTRDQCLKTQKFEFVFICPFVITGAERVAARTQLNVRANYIYEMSQTSSITVIDQPIQPIEPASVQ